MANVAFNYAGGIVDQQTLEAALDFIIAIEPDPEEFAEECARLGLDESEEYQKIQSKHAQHIEFALAALRQYGRQITPPTMEALRKRFYEIVQSDKYQTSAKTSSICYSTLNRAWKGVNGWAP